MSRSNNSDIDDGVSGGEERALPAEVWASVMQYLPFETILSCAATSRMILRNAIPLLKTLHIDKPSQMNLALAYRFRDVTEININCLLKITNEPNEPEWPPDADIDFESRMRTIPFISKFQKLERMIFMGQGEDGEVLKRFAIANAYFFDDDLDTPTDRMITLIDSISGAFRCGALPKKLKVLGLCCPKVKEAAQTMEQPSSCDTCLRACKSFPLESVLHFESRQSSTSHAISGRLHELDVCLQISEIESVIESRPGGHELLRSDERLLRLLGSGRHYELPADDGETLHIVSYSDDQLFEIKRVIEYAELNVKEIPSPNVTAAILRSFATHNRALLPPSTRRYLSPLSIEYLTSKIGLLIDAKDFEVPPANIIKHFLAKIGLILADEESDEFNGIEPHCTRLIFDFLEVTDTLCQQVDDVIPGLVQRLRDNQSDRGDLRHYLVRSLMNIIVKGTPEQEQVVVNEGGIPPLIQCLESSKISVVIAALQALVRLATGRSKKHREKVITTKTIPRFIELLDSDHDKCVESSLSLLVTAAKSHVIGMCDKSPIPRLTRIMKSASRLHMLPECSTLLVNIVDFGQPLIQDVIDTGILPTVIDIFSMHDDSTVQTNLAHVLTKLATSDQTGVVVKVDGLLPLLIALLDSSNDVIANDSIVALGNIVNIAPEYRDMVVEAGVMKHLLHMINHSDKFFVLKNATETFSQCCRGKSTDFSASRAALNALTQLFVTYDIGVLRHACWALFHLLDGLEYEDVRSVMKTQYFLKHVIDLLKQASFELEEPILKSLYLITKADKAGGIDAIIRCEGIAAISKSLSTPHEENRKLACCTIGKLISGSSDRFQAVIDSNGVFLLFNIMTQKHNEKIALCVIYEAVEVATPLQIQYLVAQDCVKHICAFLTTEVKAITGSILNTEIAALRILKKILAVTYHLLLAAQTKSNRNKKTLEMIGSTLGKLADESLQRVHEAKIVKLLKKKKAWLEVDACEKRVESLVNAVTILVDQLQQADQQLHSLQEKSIKAGKTSFAGKVCDKLIEKQNEGKFFIANQLAEANKEVSGAVNLLSRLSTEAEEIAPKAEWYARLAKNDLPADLDGVIKALHVSTSNLKSLADIRVSSHTTFSICEMREGFEWIYRNLDADSRRKNGCDENSSHDSDCQIVEPPQKKRYLTDLFESDAKRKKQGNESKHEESDESVYSACTLPFPPFEPLLLWKSPYQGGEAKGLPPRLRTETRPDEYGVEETVTDLFPAPIETYSKESTYAPEKIARYLRPHQREGVQFMYECVMGLKDFDGAGCILADDMGLGKTLQSVALIWALLQTGITANKEKTCKRVVVICPCSLVKNWDNEFVKWLGPGVVKTLALAESDHKTVEKNIDCFVKTKMFQVLIASYETMRTHVGRLNKYKDCCDLLVCDEAHRLKNRVSQTSMALASLPCKRRVLLTGTPMQNDLEELFAMVDFTNPGILGTQEEFRRQTLAPILRGREPGATEKQKIRMNETQLEMSSMANNFILRRVNTLNAQHLPPKLVQVVCCNLTEIQQNMYAHLCNSKAMQHVLDGKQVNCLGSIQMLMKLCNHPSLVVEDKSTDKFNRTSGRATKKISYAEEEKQTSAAPEADGIARYMPQHAIGGGKNAQVLPELSGKMFVLWRLMREMRKPGNGGDKIVIVSNYTQTLDLIGRMCKENNWMSCRLDGSITMKKRQKMCDEFNDPSSSLVAFLLSSKAGGCGLNLIGGNRLVLFDPDWNPAVDKQAAARCWRDGQKKRCFTYRFLSTGTVEEKIFQRQLSKEGLQSVVDDKEQVNALSTKDLKNLYKLRQGTPSDTHDKLKCERCKVYIDDAEAEAAKVLPKKLAACRELLDELMKLDDSTTFLTPLKPDEHGVSLEEYQKLVKQPMDFGTVLNRIDKKNNSSGYGSPAAFSKDVSRVFSNVLKVWEPGQELADTAGRLQIWWIQKWTELVPTLMFMKSDSDNDEKENDSELNTDGECLAAPSYLNNERGEDYQEQIGMPDEENMRSWSHHHSTDTVDDPIFRAAMRGYDQVSFVFGLEVTWSIIQQRQQDEEERQAMLEFESMKEMNEAFDIDTVKDKEDGDDMVEIRKEIENKHDESDISVCTAPLQEVSFTRSKKPEL